MSRDLHFLELGIGLIHHQNIDLDDIHAYRYIFFLTIQIEANLPRFQPLESSGGLHFYKLRIVRIEWSEHRS